MFRSLFFKNLDGRENIIALSFFSSTVPFLHGDSMFFCFDSTRFKRSLANLLAGRSVSAGAPRDFAACVGSFASFPGFV